MKSILKDYVPECKHQEFINIIHVFKSENV